MTANRIKTFSTSSGSEMHESIQKQIDKWLEKENHQVEIISTTSSANKYRFLVIVSYLKY